VLVLFLSLGGCQAMIGRTAGRVASSVTTFNTGFHVDKFAIALVSKSFISMPER
jgi:hypothetical protein